MKQSPLAPLRQHWGYPLSATALAVFAGSALAAPAATIARIATTPRERPVEVITLAETATDPQGRGPDQRPALLIVAGLQGHHAVGTDTARALADRILADHPDLLAARTVYILAQANPDGAARFRSATPFRAESGRAPQPADADRDGRTDEDPPNDLNDDGIITLMRVPAPNPRYGIEPTHLIDPDDPRLMRTPKPADAESAVYALVIEGTDDDGDGAFNEDGWAGVSGGGIDLDRHFPTHWPEHTDGAGLYPLARPEASALVQWAQAHNNIVAVLVYGPHDTLTTIPPTGKLGPEGKVTTGIEEGDKPYYEKVSESFKDITGITKAPDSPDRAGSFLQWAYADLGVFAFGTPVWVRPEPDAGSADESTDPASAPVTDAAPDLEQRVAADKAALADQGVPPALIAFLYMSPEDRAAEVAAFQTRPAEEQQAEMAAIAALPAEVQQRLMAVAQGGPDPGAPAAQDPADPDAPALDDLTTKKKVGEGADAAWLEWIDSERAGEGFVPWTPFDHPQLGPVEIGGFVPGVRVNPPPDLAGPLVDQQTAFVGSLLAMFPALEVDAPTVERVGPGLWRISITLRNTGLLPTASASGVKAERLPGIIVVLDPEQNIEPDRLIAGRRVTRIDAIEGSGADSRAQWLIAADEGAQTRVEVRSAAFGDRGFDVSLSNNQGDEQ